jgi:hypothetical protein
MKFMIVTIKSIYFGRCPIFLPVFRLVECLYTGGFALDRLNLIAPQGLSQPSFRML